MEHLLDKEPDFAYKNYCLCADHFEEPELLLALSKADNKSVPSIFGEKLISKQSRLFLKPNKKGKNASCQFPEEKLLTQFDNSTVENEDLKFFLTLIPIMKKLTMEQSFRVKMKIQSHIFDAAYFKDIYGEHYEFN